MLFELNAPQILNMHKSDVSQKLVYFSPIFWEFQPKQEDHNVAKGESQTKCKSKSSLPFMGLSKRAGGFLLK